MSLKDILVVANSARDVAALRAGASLANQPDAQLRCAVLSVIPEVTFSDAGFSAQFVADMIAQTRDQAARDLTALKKLGDGLPVQPAFEPIESLYGAAADRVALAARHADLTIVSAPAGDEKDVRRMVFESILFGSGGPVLVVPDSWKGGEIGRKIVVAWNASRESSRAMRDALALFGDVKAVSVVTVDARPSLMGHGDVPGGDVAAHLARHNLHVDVKNADSMGRTVAGVLFDEARETGADLIVMGGYGHARLQQIVFGGATRDLSAATELPLLMSH